MIDRRISKTYWDYEFKGNMPERLKALFDSIPDSGGSAVFLGISPSERTQELLGELAKTFRAEGGSDHEKANEISDELLEIFDRSLNEMQAKYNDFINAVNGNIGR
jgi:hypothetical protein